MNILKKGIQTLKNDGIGAFFKRAGFFLTIRAKKMIAPVYVLVFAPFVKKKIAEFNDQDSARLFDFISYHFLGFFAPMQIREEFIALLELISQKKIFAVLEIGTAKGGALFCFSKIAESGATIVSVDLPSGPFGGGYDTYKVPFYQKFGIGKNLILLRGNSHQDEMRKEVGRVFGRQQLDILFIDGDHTYDGVKQDFEMYKDLVRSGGKIIFHDIAPMGDKRVAGGVKFFWKEIKEAFPHREIIAHPLQNGFGIGVIDVP